MHESFLFKPPPVDEQDVIWACGLLNLPDHAFSGFDGNDPRLEILKSNETIDIAACPGSGKTTLLVAKLAILSRKWTDSRRGICVLSHTNVARREIEHGLGNRAEARRLLSYPHFVGTIHGFVNEFLAIPWLRYLGYPIRIIDNDQCEKHRRRMLALKRFSSLATYVRNREVYANVVSQWFVASANFEVCKSNDGNPEFKNPGVRSATELSALAKETVKHGYHRHDEMFTWANNLLDKIPHVADVIQERFPMLFIDEVQDNSELQSALLYRLFMEGNCPVIRQRFGDANQAIFQNADQSKGASTDPFPGGSIRKDIPNSHRFGQEIADIANPLALEPQNLRGLGPPSRVITSNTTGKNTIFLFSDQTVLQVLEVYAGYLQEVFCEEDLRNGTFYAVGGTHRPGSNDRVPHCVGHYWPEYDHELTATEPRPKTFSQYIMAGRSLAIDTGEACHLVEKIADGLLSLACPINRAGQLGNRRRNHRYIMELLADKPEKRSAYLDLVMSIAVERNFPSVHDWSSKWSITIRQIAESIGGEPLDPDAAKEFLEYPLSDMLGAGGAPFRQRDNVFRHPVQNPKVRIRVGSIHSVKGETHTATLVLETFYFDHHLAKLKPWLLGIKSGKGEEKVRMLSRLKQHYVAMTRPSHLLCIAMRRDDFKDEELAQLKGIWRIANITVGGTVWL